MVIYTLVGAATCSCLVLILELYKTIFSRYLIETMLILNQGENDVLNYYYRYVLKCLIRYNKMRYIMKFMKGNSLFSPTVEKSATKT